MPLEEIDAPNRKILVPLFQNCAYDQVLIGSVLEGNFGRAFADSASQPTTARLDSGAFTMLGGNPLAACVRDLLSLAPIEYVTPQNERWRQLLQGEFGNRITPLTFVNFSPVTLHPAHLASLSRGLPDGLEHKRIDQSLAERLAGDTGNDNFMENYNSIRDFLERGVGFCILFGSKIVSAASAMAQCRNAIDIEIETQPDFQKRGLGTVVGAKLVFHCLERGIKPHWLAANAVSEKLALKLGFTPGESYETFTIKPPD